MKYPKSLSRRHLLRTSLIGAAGVPFLSFGSPKPPTEEAVVHTNYPSIEPEIVSEVVGKSHFDLDRVKELVDARPELARATWDWGFGDFETAVGAAAHVGRRDIVQYLHGKGARPNIFSYTVLGAHDVVKAMIEFTPGIQQTFGPHGISLLSHAKAGLRQKDQMSTNEIDDCNRLIGYLESLGDADGEQYEEVPEEEKPRYVGDYKYGDQDHEGFSVRLNMRKMLSLGKIGAFGGALWKVGENQFYYNGAPSTEVSFQFEGDTVTSLTVKEPDSELVAKKV